MKKIIVFAAFVFALGGAIAAGRLSADLPPQAALETQTMLAMTPAPQWLPTEAYEAN